MINGVILIVAAVLFAVVYLSSDMGIIWLWIAGAYLVFGVGNLAIYAIKNKYQLRAARKQAQKTSKESEKASLLMKQTATSQEKRDDIPAIAGSEENKATII